MNARNYQRIFTDLIPAYYEKTAFLKESGRQELADIHDYFLYKRLLLLYYQLEESKAPDKDKYLEKFTKIIRDDRERYAAAFGCPVADSRDDKKMRLFLKSPARYVRRVRLEERVIVPCKAKIKKLLFMKNRK